MRAVMLSSAGAEQNDSIFQISPKDNAHHEHTASRVLLGEKCRERKR